jgi:glycosyltransferase involved in cell wall biosynthesis
MRDLTLIPFVCERPFTATGEKQKKVSVVVPVFDTEGPVLERCLQSCLAQSMDESEYEIIVADDGSRKADTLRVLRKYAEKHPSRLRLERLPRNGGVSAARNRGMDSAVGAYVFFVDGDDYIGAEALARMHAFGKANNADLINGKYGGTDGRWRPPYGDAFGNVARADLHKHDVACMSTVHRMFRRAKIDEMKLRFDTNIASGQDAVFLCRFLAHTDKISNLFDYECYFLTAPRLSLRRNSPAEFAYSARARFSAIFSGALRDKSARDRHAAIHFAILFRRFVRDFFAEDATELLKREATEAFAACVRDCLPEEADLCLAEDMRAAAGFLRDVSRSVRNPDEIGEIVRVKWREYPAGRPEERSEVGSGTEAATGTGTEAVPPANAAGPGARAATTAQPDVSLVLPIYNVEPYLREALDSAVGQSLKNIEIICVNDGSTDGSPRIVREYARRDSRIVVVDKPNAGYGHAMNVGIDRASGKYVAILEPDDRIERTMLEELFALASKHNLDIVKSDFNRFRGEGKTLVKTLNRCCNDARNYNAVLDPAEHLEIFRYVMNTWCGIYRRDFLTQNNIRHNETPGAAFQDNGFYFQTMCLAKRIMYVDRQFYMNRRDNPGSSVKSRDKVYAVNNEHAFINAFFEKNGTLNSVYKGVHFLRKFGNYKFTLSRTDESVHLEYMKKISEEFGEDMRLGNIDKKTLNPFEWHDVRWIIRDPYEYYFENIRNRIKVSVVVPVHNAEKYLRECIRSIVNQTLKEIEIIFVDDGSDDSSLAIIEEFAGKDERIKVFTQKNGGAGAARNLGMDAARGRYLSFLDADDLFDPAMLKKAYNKALADDEAVICMFKARQYDTLTGETAPIPDALRTDKLPKQRPFSVNYVSSNIFSVTKAWPWNKLFKKTFIENNGIRFQEIPSSNDMYFTFAALLKAQKITVLDEELVTYRVNGATSIQNNLDKTWESFYSARKKIQREMSEMNVYELHKKAFADFVLDGYFWFLKKLNRLNPVAAEQFFDKGGAYFKEFGVAGHTRGYFENKKSFDKYEIMAKMQQGDFKRFKPYL